MFQHVRKLTGRPYASTLVRAAKGGDDGVRGWRHDARDRKRGGGGRVGEGRGGEGGVFPHYKFNLTNGSENLETMEYMKCGRVYHVGGETRGGSDGNIVRADPYSPKARRREGRRGSRGGESGSRPGWGRTSERQNMLLARQEAARGGGRTVSVAFESCRASAGISSLVSLFPTRRE